MSTTWAERRQVAARVQRGQPANVTPRRQQAPRTGPTHAGGAAAQMLAADPVVARKLSRALRSVAATEGPEAALALLLEGLDARAGVTRSATRSRRSEVRG